MNFAITAKAVVVTPDAGQTKVYGSATPTLTFTTSSALESGDSLSGALTQSGSDVGNYAIGLGTLGNSNYNVSLSGTPVNFTITTKAVTVTPDAGLSKTYGSADPTFTYTTLGLESGDSFTGSLSRAAGSNVGDYVINKGTLGNSNYNISLSGTPVNFAITAKAVTVTPDSGQSKTYGAADPTFTYSTSPALVVGDSFTGALSRAAGSDVGTYAITLGTLGNSNYAVSLSGTPVNFTINKKAVTVTADSFTKLNTTIADPTFTWTSPGLVSSDLSGTLERLNKSNAAGIYDITAGTLTNENNPNYNITFVKGTLTVEVLTPVRLSWIARNGTVDATGKASLGAKVEVTALGGGTGELTWSAPGCTVTVVSGTTQELQVSGQGSCTLTVKRAANGSYPVSEVSQTFTWSNK